MEINLNDIDLSHTLDYKLNAIETRFGRFDRLRNSTIRKSNGSLDNLKSSAI